MHLIHAQSGDPAERARLRTLGISKFQGVKLLAVGSYLPETILTNAEVAAQIHETVGGYAGLEAGESQALDPGTVEMILRDRIGTDRRHVSAPDQMSEHLMAEAGRRALESAGLPASAVDVIYACPNPPWFNVPPSHCIVADMLGLRSGVGGSTINVACTGNIEAIRNACYDLTVGNADCVMITGANAMGPIPQARLPFARASDRGIFGDGGGAIILTRNEASQQPWVIQRREDALHWLRILHPLRTDTPVIQVPDKNVEEMFPSGSRRAPPDYVASVGKGFHMEGPASWFNDWVEKGFVPHILAFMEEVGISHQGVLDNPPGVFLPHQPNWGLTMKTLGWTGFDKHRDRMIEVYKEGADLISGEFGVAMDQSIRTEQLKRGMTVFVYIYGSGFTQGNLFFTYE